MGRMFRGNLTFGKMICALAYGMQGVCNTGSLKTVASELVMYRMYRLCSTNKMGLYKTGFVRVRMKESCQYRVHAQNAVKFLTCCGNTHTYSTSYFECATNKIVYTRGSLCDLAFDLFKKDVTTLHKGQILASFQLCSSTSVLCTSFLMRIQQHYRLVGRNYLLLNILELGLDRNGVIQFVRIEIHAEFQYEFFLIIHARVSPEIRDRLRFESGELKKNECYERKSDVRKMLRHFGLFEGIIL